MNDYLQIKIHGVKYHKGDSEATSKGNIVSPPASTFDRYNKKEATCTIKHEHVESVS